MSIRVLAAVVEQNGTVLVCQRPVHKRHGGLWEFPGGKFEPGESEFDAAAREMMEELGVSVSAVGERYHAIADPGSEFVIEFFPVAIRGEPTALEHSAIQWLPFESLTSVDLAPSDRAFVRAMLTSDPK